MNVVKQILTEADDETYDTVRLVACGAIVAMVIFQALTWQQFNPLNFGGGIAAILAAVVGHDRLNTNAP